MDPLHTATVEFSEPVTSLMEIHFNQKMIHSPFGPAQRFLNCLWPVKMVDFDLNLKKCQVNQL